jgi:hypothetical protein
MRSARNRLFVLATLSRNLLAQCCRDLRMRDVQSRTLKEGLEGYPEFSFTDHRLSQATRPVHRCSRFS